MNCAIGLVSSDEGDMMRDTEPKIEVTDHVAHKSTARIGAYRGECTESAVVLEECSGQCDGSIISDSISVRELCVVLENDEETDITRSIGTDHVSVTPTDEDSYIGLLHKITKSTLSSTTQSSLTLMLPSHWPLHSSSTTALSVHSPLYAPILAVLL